MIEFILILLTLPSLIELGLINIGFLVSLFKKNRDLAAAHKPYKVALLIPAHNEEKVIGKTFDSVKNLNFKPDVYVIADHCTDRTIDLARERGFHVLERKEPQPKGKTWGLEYAFSQLPGYEAYFILDADSTISPNTLDLFQSHLDLGHNIVQFHYLFEKEDSLRKRLFFLKFEAFTYARPLARQALGLSAGLFGNGWGINAHVLKNVPFHLISTVEDLEYFMKLSLANERIYFSDESQVVSSLPQSSKGYSTQSARWESGRFKLMPHYFFPLIKACQFDALINLLTLPLSYLAVILVLGLILNGSVYFTFGLILLALHMLSALYLINASSRDYLALFMAPVFLIQKIIAIPKTLKEIFGRSQWKRTER